MPDYVVAITEQAQRQMGEIFQYIARVLQAPQAALTLLDTMEQEIQALSLFPKGFPLVEEEPWRSHGIRKLVVRHYLVYFWVDEQTHKVQVTAVVYGKRDQAQQLRDLALE